MKCIPWCLHTITRLAISVWRKPPKATDVPEAIADRETIVRAVFYPYHLKKSGTELTKVAFKSPPDKDEVSVIRKTFVDEQFCKDKAKDIELAAICRDEDDKAFRGFAVISAQAIRDRKSTRLNSSHIQKSRMPSSA